MTDDSLVEFHSEMTRVITERLIGKRETNGRLYKEIRDLKDLLKELDSQKQEVRMHKITSDQAFDYIHDGVEVLLSNWFGFSILRNSFEGVEKMMFGSKWFVAKTVEELAKYIESEDGDFYVSDCVMKENSHNSDGSNSGHNSKANRHRVRG